MLCPWEAPTDACLLCVRPANAKRRRTTDEVFSAASAALLLSRALARSPAPPHGQKVKRAPSLRVVEHGQIVKRARSAEREGCRETRAPRSFVLELSVLCCCAVVLLGARADTAGAGLLLRDRCPDPQCGQRLARRDIDANLGDQLLHAPDQGARFVCCLAHWHV